jgi:hypothetical protein
MSSSRGAQAVRDAEREAHLKALEKEHPKRLAAVRAEAEAGRRRQKALLTELGVPDLSPEEVTERAQRDRN